MTIDELKKQLEEQVRHAVEQGHDIREKVGRMTADASRVFHERAESLSDLVKAVLKGASEGLRASPAGRADSVLRQVIDGLGDAFAASAQAVQLTLEEARSKGAAFAREDLDRVVRDFRSLGDMFVETVERGLKAVGSQASAQSDALREHARHTFSQLRTHLHKATAAASDNLAALPTEAFQAGAEAMRQATGTFFTLMGQHLKEAGERMNRSDTDTKD